MNQHLQNILNTIQQDKNLSEEEKNAIIKSLKDADKEFEITNFKLDRTEKVKRTTAILLEETIEELEQKRKAVEAQNRELEIESSLERVRAVAMSMMKADDLLKICEIQFNELKQLGFSELRNALIGIFHDEKNYFTDYDYSDFAGGNIHKIPYNMNSLVDRAVMRMKSANDAFTEFIVKGEELKEWKAFRKQNGEYDDTRIENAEILYYYFYSINNGNIGISTFKKISDDQLTILKRFRNVFDLAYKRYIDITTAEVQAREAKIEAALEKVRSRSLAVHKSNEFNDVIKVVFEKLQELGFRATAISINTFIENSNDTNVYLCGQYDSGSGQHITHYVLPHFDEVISNERVAAQKGTADFFTKTYYKEDKDAFYKKVYELSDLKHAPENVKQTISNSNAYTISLAISKKSMIVVNDFEGNILSENEIDVIKRFARVFEQSYTRFLDLQKSEAQSREAQIQLAMERVRARTMAMQHSNELPDAANLLFQQVQSLGMPAWSAGYCTWKEDKTAVTAWMSSEGVLQPPFTAPTTEDELFIEMRKGQEDGKTFHVVEMGGDELKKHYQYMRTLPVMDKILDSIIDAGYPLPGFQIMHHAYFSKGFLLFITYEPVPESHDIFKRFANVFDQTYTRFLDLKKAEAQARESQIETALERVRSRSMGMQKSDELMEVIQIIYEQFLHLKVKLDHAGFVVDYQPKGNWHFWIADSQEIPAKITHPYFDSVWAKQFDEAKEKGSAIFATRLNREEKNKFYEELFSYVPGLPEQSKEYYFSKPGLDASTAIMDDVSLYIENFEGIRYTDEENNTIMRFGKVFQQTYTRFLDLQKSEAQSRENQIQLALERARSQSMIMQHSKELDDTLRVFHEQVLLLNIPSAFSFLWLPDEENDKHIFWAAWKENKNDSAVFKSKAINYPLDRNEPATAQCLIDWKGTEPIVSYHVPPDGVTNYFAAWSELIAGVEQLKPAYFSDGLYYVEAFMKYGCFGVIVTNDLTEDQKKILGRFAIEFERTYRRFLDLQKAEAQAREAQIEAALEKVRSRSLAMHASNELKEVISVLFVKLRELAVTMDSACILTFDEDGKGHTVWAANPDLFSVTSTYVPYSDDPIHKRIYEERQTGNFLDQTWTFEEKNSMYAYLFEHTGWRNFPDDLKKTILNFEGWGFTGPVTKNSATLLVSYSNKTYSQHEKEIINRIGKVFDQAYTRFLDLQKCETQAREAQIEVSLERVRAKAMSMHKSEDLHAAVATVFEELEKLDIGVLRCGISVLNKEKRCGKVWLTSTDQGKTVQVTGDEPFDIHPLLQGAFDAWLKQEDFYYVLEGEDLVSYYKAVKTAEFMLPESQLLISATTIKQYCFVAVYNSGGLFAFQESTFTEEAKKIMRRFAAVFDLTYKRFLDLQKAEAQAKEAQIETALEKVRSRTLAMQKSDELAETAAVLFRQLILLGIQPNRLYIAIVKDDRGTAEFWITDEDGSQVSSAFETNLNDNPTFQKMFDGWKAEKKSLVIDMRGAELQEYFKYLTSIHVPFKGGLTQTRRLQDIAYFGKGFIGMASPDELPAETLQLLERFAAVFNLTYTRFNDLQVSEAHAIQAEQDLIAIKEAKQKAEAALSELQATQKQLIQSEKMASLGELTAGIAHEIQNPLNFVNNFSEVNTELIAELVEEVDKGNTAEVKAIAKDIKENEQKINHHGKRADAIVKGMLQHSRTTSSTKEPTDINKLADEYLRLAYHGIRAKDNSFNATLKTDYDETIGNINIIPQDIGRVILNLITNAFYAVNTPQPPKGRVTYVPTVSVSTIKVNDKIEVKVSDNGTGIPKNIVDKIFQPFFTTKPTGQGTGLGLSLTYDIIKAHGGEIKVETKEGEGTEFIILLPIA